MNAPRFLISLLTCLVLATALANLAAQTMLVSGDVALVQVQDPTGLRVRAAPGITHDVVENLFTGDLVTLLDGPQDADGLSWWQVRTPSGSVGWSVAAADGVQTLLPLAPIPPAYVLRLLDRVYYAEWAPNNQTLGVALANGDVAFYLLDVHITALESGETPTAFVPILRNQAFVEQIRYAANYPFAEVTAGDAGRNPEAPLQRVVFDYLIYDIGGVINDSPIPDEVLPDDIVWNEPVTVRTNSACQDAEPVIIQHPQGSLQAGDPAQFTTADGTVLELGDGSGGIAWSAQSSLALIWSGVEPLEGETRYQGTAEVWDLTEGKRLIVMPHASPHQSTCGIEARPAALSPDGQRLATIISTPGDSYLLIWSVTPD